MTFYSDMALTAAQLIAEFGQSVTVTKYGIGVEDVTTGVVTSTSVNSIVKGVLLDFDYRTFGEGVEHKSTVLGVNKRLLMTTTVVINVDDTVTVDNQTYRVIVAKLLNPAGTRVMYDLWIQQ